MDIGSLPVAQLSQVKKQLDEEVQHLTSSYSSLRSAQNKFKDCANTICNGITAPAKPLLVPLTTSLYVPGRLADTEHVLVDVGTGFYVEKSLDEAIKFYEGKTEEIGKNVKDLETIVNQKAQSLRVVEEVLRQKMMAQQQGGGASASAS